MVIQRNQHKPALGIAETIIYTISLTALHACMPGLPALSTRK